MTSSWRHIYAADDGRLKGPNEIHRHPSPLEEAPERPSPPERLPRALLTTMMAPAVAAGDNRPPPQPSYAEQVLASNGDNAIDPVLAPTTASPPWPTWATAWSWPPTTAGPMAGTRRQPNSIVQRRSTDNGKTWGAPTYIARGQMPAAGPAASTASATPAMWWTRKPARLQLPRLLQGLRASRPAAHRQ